MQKIIQNAPPKLPNSFMVDYKRGVPDLTHHLLAHAIKPMRCKLPCPVAFLPVERRVLNRNCPYV